MLATTFNAAHQRACAQEGKRRVTILSLLYPQEPENWSGLDTDAATVSGKWGPTVWMTGDKDKDRCSLDSHAM